MRPRRSYVVASVLAFVACGQGDAPLAPTETAISQKPAASVSLVDATRILSAPTPYRSLFEGPVVLRQATFSSIAPSRAVYTDFSVPGPGTITVNLTASTPTLLAVAVTKTECNDVNAAFQGACSNLLSREDSASQPWETSFSVGAAVAARLWVGNPGSIDPGAGLLRATFTPPASAGSTLFSGVFAELPPAMATTATVIVPESGSLTTTVTRAGGNTLYLAVTDPSCTDVGGAMAGTCSNLAPVDRGMDAPKVFTFPVAAGTVTLWVGNPGSTSESGTVTVVLLPGPGPTAGSPAPGAPTPAPQPTPQPTPTPRPELTPTPASSCCKHCGPNSQPCGDTCISLAYQCHTPPGCACN